MSSPGSKQTHFEEDASKVVKLNTERRIGGGFKFANSNNAKSKVENPLHSKVLKNRTNNNVFRERRNSGEEQISSIAETEQFLESKLKFQANIEEDNCEQSDMNNPDNRNEFENPCSDK
mmetsp:Transcript_29238/g.33495  ORF Transcript_29238/g.33495 Transcript_29238/m.33495 type:complete len:119 (-) Transcript_29238:2429-2785(-)